MCAKVRGQFLGVSLSAMWVLEIKLRLSVFMLWVMLLALVLSQGLRLAQADLENPVV